MAWYGHDPTPAQIEAEAKRKADDQVNAANKRLKEAQAGGYNVATTWPRR